MSLTKYIPPFVLIIDQVFKYLSIRSDSYILNSNLALGFNAPNLVIIIISISIFLGIIIFIYRTDIKIIKNLLYFILYGGLSNLFDRLIRGGVVDYIKIFDITYINISDVVITLSILFLIIVLLTDGEEDIFSKEK